MNMFISLTVCTDQESKIWASKWVILFFFSELYSFGLNQSMWQRISMFEADPFPGEWIAWKIHQRVFLSMLQSSDSGLALGANGAL